AIYALGAMLFELLTGRMVFDARTAADMIARHLFEPPRSPSALARGIPPQLDVLVTSMLAKDAAHRPTIGQIRSELRMCRATLGLHTPIEGVPMITDRAGTNPLPGGSAATPFSLTPAIYSQGPAPGVALSHSTV